MKEVINVSIAGIAFKLDDEAYKMLDTYLIQINKHYKNFPDGREIIEDIEARIAEIILSKQDSSLVVTTHLICTVISQLGMPEDMENSAEGDCENNEPSGKDYQSSSKFPKRLYRNPFNAKLGGVCSGLATYFNIDVTLIRLFFLSPIILGLFLGVWLFKINLSEFISFMPAFIFIYLIMWIVIPKAKTPRQILEMKGERITQSSIERIFVEEFRGAGKSLEKVRKDASSFAKVVGFLGKFFLFFIYTILAIMGLSMLVLLIYVVISGINFFGVGSHNFILGSMTGPIYALIVLALIVVVLPLVVGIYSIIKWIFSFGWNKNFLYIALIGWIAAFASCAVIYFAYFHSTDYEVKLKNIKVEGRSFYNEKKERKIKFERDNDNMQFFITETAPDFNILSGTVKSIDTLHVMPIDTVRGKGFRSIPVNFIWGSAKYKTPTIEIKRTYHNILIDIIKRKKLPEFSPVGFCYTGDTLYVNNFFKTTKMHEYARIDIYLPEHLDIDVDESIRYYEFDYWD